ncbi:hypothetical protein HU200_001176 [Digitaria exilis]|uniref:Uncharacterized protein n=1 Tax=Digitaria exilis TaxID=1010633 RepID=A0A835BQL0_9POAL|nr:hypothetical protein HU200_031359 [Digitaria exilis]KAF8780759.1 hypothetical protein HU200_001176 [Digitaria exilis]
MLYVLIFRSPITIMIETYLDMYHFFFPVINILIFVCFFIYQVAFLQEFKIFKDKSLAINVETSLSKQFSDFIVKHHRPGQKIAVGKLEYKNIIETKLKIQCLYNDVVMEIMWGLKNIMKSLIPDQKCGLTKEDRCYMSKGMQSILNRYGFEVKPEMVNEDIIIMAATLYECDYCVNKFAKYFLRGGEHLQNVSGICPKGWDLQKIAAALKLVCYPEEKIEAGISDQVNDVEEMVETLVADAHKYEDMLHKGSCLNIYLEILSAREARKMALTLLESSINKAKGACATHKEVEPDEHGVGGGHVKDEPQRDEKHGVHGRHAGEPPA